MLTKDCPKCEKPHTKPGKFCSRSCANSRVFSPESCRKKSAALRGRRPACADAIANKTSVAYLKWLTTKRLRQAEKIRNTPFEQRSLAAKRQTVFADQNFCCADCGLSAWRGVKITLELEHCDGDNKNNARDNLKGLCPNCHSLTLTWRGRNRKKNRKVSNEELLNAIKTGGSIARGLQIVGLTAKGKNYKRAERLLEIGAPGVAPGSQD